MCVCLDLTVSSSSRSRARVCVRMCVCVCVCARARPRVCALKLRYNISAPKPGSFSDSSRIPPPINASGIAHALVALGAPVALPAPTQRIPFILEIVAVPF